MRPWSIAILRFEGAVAFSPLQFFCDQGDQNALLDNAFVCELEILHE